MAQLTVYVIVEYAVIVVSSKVGALVTVIAALEGLATKVVFDKTFDWTASGCPRTVGDSADDDALNWTCVRC